jgi:hypothetical protein
VGKAKSKEFLLISIKFMIPPRQMLVKKIVTINIVVPTETDAPC